MVRADGRGLVAGRGIICVAVYLCYVGIWSALHDGKSWSKPVELANGVQDEKTRFPCWNPILFQPKDAPLLLFYKVGTKPSNRSALSSSVRRLR